MKRHRILRTLSIALCGATLLLSGTAMAQEELRPFTARYQVRFYGLSGGHLELTLHKGETPNVYMYDSRAFPSFLGSFAISSSARESSTMEIDTNGVRPLKFVSEDGKKGDDQDSTLEFDWNTHRLTGRSEGRDMDREMTEPIYDHQSIQIAVIWRLQHDLDLGEFLLVDGGEVKRYAYTKEGTAAVRYKGRDLDAIVVRSERADSPGGRINRYWHAVEFGYIPVRAERSRDGKIDLKMELVDLKFAE